MFNDVENTLGFELNKSIVNFNRNVNRHANCLSAN